MNFSAPHGDKLRALLGNHKLPAGDRPRVHTAIERYEAWIEELRRIEGAGENLVEPMVEALNRYKLSIDLNLVFDSKNDFLYRQKGQLKLDNTVLERIHAMAGQARIGRSPRGTRTDYRAGERICAASIRL